MPPTITPHVIFTTKDEREIPVSFLTANMGGELPSDDELNDVTSINVVMPSMPGFGGQMLQLVGLGGQPCLHKGEGDLPVGDYPVESWTHV